MLGGDGRDVRVVVLDGEGGNGPALRELVGEARAVELGVQVVDDRRGLNVEDVEQVVDGAVERRAGGGVVEVAHVLGDEGLVVAGRADGALEPAAQREHRGTLAREAHRARRVAAGTAQELRPRVGGEAHDAVVAAHEDATVVR